MIVAARHRADLEQVARAPQPQTPCTAETLRCHDATSYLAELRPCCRGHLIAMMTVVQQVFDEMGLPWWADYGTLLGAVRNPLTTWANYPWLPQEGRPEGPLAPGIIPHDKDADLGFFAADWPQVVTAANRMIRMGLHVHIKHATQGLKVRLSRINKTNIDLFGWHGGPDGRMVRSSYIQCDQFKGKGFHRRTLEPFSTVRWEGLTLPAPVNPAAFCEFRYGTEWREPIPDNNDGIRRL